MNRILSLPFAYFMTGLIVSVACSQTAFAQEAKKKKKPLVEPVVQLVKGETTIDVKVDGDLFTSLDSTTYKKPILYPVYGPGQVSMTRSWPMKDDVAGEQHDHPHHKSVWIGHEINGVHFWSEKGGFVKTVSAAIASDVRKGIRAESQWIRESDNQVLLTDSTLYQFGADEKSRWIDCSITFNASHGDFTFDDTKEGLFAIRTHPDLRLNASPKNGVEEVFGSAVNSAGDSGKKIWGKPAKWLLYHGEIDGKPMSVSMFDHPDNLRYPTTWHARDYGLVTANPFGLHHFLGKEKGAGEYLVKNGQSLKLRYRVDFIVGISTKVETELRHEMFAKDGGGGKVGTN